MSTDHVLDLDARVDPSLAAALAAKPRRMIERLEQVPRAREVMAAARPPVTLPDTVEPDDVTMDLAVQLIAEKAAKGGKKRKSSRKKKSA